MVKLGHYYKTKFSGQNAEDIENLSRFQFCDLRSIIFLSFKIIKVNKNPTILRNFSLV